VAPATTEMPAAEMPAAMAAKMTATVAATMKMTSTAVTTSTMAPAAVTAATTFRSCIAPGRQRGRKNKDGNSNLEF
jgi:hypothetical protein